MTTTTVLHTAVVREIDRIRQYLGYQINLRSYSLEAHQLAADLQHAVDELLEHCHANEVTDSPN